MLCVSCKYESCDLTLHKQWNQLKQTFLNQYQLQHSHVSLPYNMTITCKMQSQLQSRTYQSCSKPAGLVCRQRRRCVCYSKPDTTDAGLENLGTRLAWQRPDLHVVLCHPQIPQNTGNIARTCAATGVGLHLIEPLGFKLDDKQLKRAGLDYWDAVAVKTHTSWQDFYTFFSGLPGPKRLVAYTVFGDQYYGGPEFEYKPGDWLLFGAETSGLPPEAHRDVAQSGGALVKIPILDTHVRSINLAVSAGVGVFEALRQLDMGKHEVQPRSTPGLTFEETMATYHGPTS